MNAFLLILWRRERFIIKISWRSWRSRQINQWDRRTDRLVLRDLARCQAIDQYGVYLLPCPQSLACTTIIKLNPQRKPRSALISDPAPMLCKNQLLQQLSFNISLSVKVSDTFSIIHYVWKYFVQHFRQEF